MSKIKYSRSKWEVSYYGGYYSMIQDHPEISVPFKVDISVGNPQNLPWYTAQKVIKMLLLRANDLSLINELHFDLVEENTFFFTKKTLVVDKQSLSDLLSAVCNNSPEHSNLFRHYKELIMSSRISMPVSSSWSFGSKEDDRSKKNKNKKKDKSGKADKEDKSNDKSENKTASDKGEDNQGDSKNKQGEGEEQKKDKQDEKKNENTTGVDGKNQKSDEQDQNEQDTGKEKDSDIGSDIFNNEEINDEEVVVNILEEVKEFKDLLSGIKKREPYVYKNLSSGHFKKNTKFIHVDSRDKINFSQLEVHNAGQLVKLLDINFDPAVGIINSLKAGKLDQRKIAEVPAGNTNIYYLREEEQTTKPFSVAILLDQSGSMEGKMKSARSLLKTLYLAFSEIIPPDNLYIYGHSGDRSPEIYIYHDKYNHTFEERAWKMEVFAQNYDGPVIESIHQKIRDMTQDNIIFIVLSDGDPGGYGYGGKEHIDEMKRIIEKCRRDGFVTVGLGIQYIGVKGLYNYSTIINNLDQEMVKKTSHIINKVVKTEFQ